MLAWLSYAHHDICGYNISQFFSDSSSFDMQEPWDSLYDRDQTCKTKNYCKTLFYDNSANFVTRCTLHKLLRMCASA